MVMHRKGQLCRTSYAVRMILVGWTFLAGAGVPARTWAMVEGSQGGEIMRSYRFVVERDPETDLLVGYVPGWPGARTQGADIDELQQRTCARSSRCCSRTASRRSNRSSSTCAPSRSPDPWAACRSSSLGRSSLSSRPTAAARPARAARTSSSVTPMAAPPRYPSTPAAISRPRSYARSPRTSTSPWMSSWAPGERATQQADHPDSLRSRVIREALDGERAGTSSG